VQPQPLPVDTVVANSEQPPKKSKFGGKFGSTVCFDVVLVRLTTNYFSSWPIQLRVVSDSVQVRIYRFHVGHS
jgi:hypothetical protein